MIDEMTCAFDSPGSVSKVLIVTLLSRDPKRCEGQNRDRKRRRCAAGFRLLVARSGWLRSPSRPLTGCRLAQPRECKLHANTESRIRADNKALPECGAYIKHDFSCPALGMCPDVGETWHLRCGQSARPTPCKDMKTNRVEDSTSRFSQLAWRLRSNAGDQGLLMANGRS
jgi:hypothetical protein